jgi:lysophospholipase L1-like esterase
VVVVQAGINDPGGAATNTGMASVFTALRAALPSALIVAQTPWAPSQTAGANAGGKYQSMRTNLYSVMAGLAGPWILIDSLAGTWSTSKGTSSGAATGPWQTGDGNVGAPTGTGNGDIWVSADGTHPTAAGYKGLGELFAASYKPAVASM